MAIRRAGFTLVEVVIVCAFAALFALFLMGAVRTSTLINRDTYVEGEVVEMATRTADELAGVISQADRLNNCWDISNTRQVEGSSPRAGDNLLFQHRWANDSLQPIFGARIRSGDPLSFSGVAPVGTDWQIRAQWVEDTNVRYPSPLSETAFNLDLNGDGAIDATPVRVGHMEVRYYSDAAATTEVVALRKVIGGGVVRVVRDAYQVVGGAVRPVVIFSRPPATWGEVDADAMGDVVRTEADTTPALPSPEYARHNTATPWVYSAATGPADPAVQINLRIIYNPVPGAGGQAELHVMNLRRLVTRR